MTESLNRVDREGLINKVTEEKDLGKGGSKLGSFRGGGFFDLKSIPVG